MAILAVLRARAAFVVLDTATPPVRLRDIARQISAVIAIVDKRSNGVFADIYLHILSLRLCENISDMSIETYELATVSLEA